MGAGIDTYRDSDDQEEFTRRRAELAVAEARLRDREREWLTAVEELRRFEVEYLRVVGELLLERSRLLAEVASLHARRSDDEQLREEATAAEAEAAAAEEEWRTTIDDSTAEVSRAQPSEDLKALYREVARRVHPDLAENDEDRKRCTELMSRANQAYAQGDVETLRRLLEGSFDETLVRGDVDAGAQSLGRVIEQISAMWKRIDLLETSLRNLHASEMWRLKERVEVAAAKGVDLLAHLRTNLERETASLRDEVADARRPTSRS